MIRDRDGGEPLAFSKTGRARQTTTTLVRKPPVPPVRFDLRPVIFVAALALLMQQISPISHVPSMILYDHALE